MRPLKSLRRGLIGDTILGRIGRTVLVLTLAPMLLGAFVATSTVRGQLADLAEDNLRSHAVLQASAVGNMLHGATEAIRVLANDPVLHDPDRPTEQIHQQLISFGLFDDLTLIDTDGIAIESTSFGFTGRWDASAAFRTALAGDIMITPVLYEADMDRHVVRVSAPVVESSGVSAVVVGSLDMARIWNILDSTKIGETGFVTAMDRHGNVISHPDKTLLLERIDVLESKDVSVLERSVTARARDGATLVGRTTEIEEFGWTIGAFQRESETYGVANAMLRAAAAAAVAVLVIASLTAIILSRTIATPLRRLSAAMGRVAEGQLDLRVGTHGLAEVDVLADSFNTMAVKLDRRGQSLHAEMTVRQRAEDRIRYQAHHDALTGLPNRTLLKERLDAALSTAQRAGEPLAVMFLDLDRFKLVNDSVGHSSGDALLQSVADRLLAAVREGDSVARVGGDEYVVLLPRLSRANHAVEVAERVHAGLLTPHELLGRDFRVTTSIGIAMYPDDGTDAETLLRNADTAMYYAKGEGKGCTKLFSADMDVSVKQRVAMERDLEVALEEKRFVLHYQPQVDTRSGRIVGFEALLRLRDPVHGLVAPDRFIPIAEETGIIWDIGRWVLDTACAHAQALMATGLIDPVPMAVNVSARQFHDAGIIDVVREALAGSGLPADQLELEITESTAMRDVEHTTHTLLQLKKMGIRVSIDDFGTGYSSLAHLKRFPVDSVKIDRSFVSDITVDEDSAAIVDAIIGLATTLSMTTIAEGVETAEQLAFLVEKGCPTFQGYLFSPALPAPELADLLARQSPSSSEPQPATPARVGSQLAYTT